jgi:hypothetical protein
MESIDKYEMALKRAKKLLKNMEKDECFASMEDIKIIFPELKLSEDERIRKAIHIYLDWLDGRKDYAPKGEYSIRDMIAWLEKQGERKDAAEYGYKFAVEKACEWIRQQKEMLEDSFSDVNDFADLLKEAMEEKQGSVLSNSSNVGKKLTSD